LAILLPYIANNVYGELLARQLATKIYQRWAVFGAVNVIYCQQC
jgi:hypothetical protein